MRVFRDRSASLTVCNVSYVMELVFYGPMTPAVFAGLYAKAIPFLDVGAVLCDTRSLIPLGNGADFVCLEALGRDCAVVVSAANADNAHHYSLAVSRRGVVKMIFFDYGQALRWVVRRRLHDLQYPAPATLTGCG